MKAGQYIAGVNIIRARITKKITPASRRRTQEWHLFFQYEGSLKSIKLSMNNNM